jgi:hypothetical protein
MDHCGQASALFAICGEFNSGKFSVSSGRLGHFLVGLPRLSGPAIS